MSTSSSLDKSVATKLELERAPSTSSLLAPFPLPSSTPLAEPSTKKAPRVSTKPQKDQDTENQKPAVKGEGKGELKRERLLSASGLLPSSAGSVNKPSSSSDSSVQPSSTARSPLGKVVTDPSNGSGAAGSSSRWAHLTIEEKEKLIEENEEKIKERTEQRLLLAAEGERLKRKVALSKSVLDVALRVDDLMSRPSEERLDTLESISEELKDTSRLVTSLLARSSLLAEDAVATGTFESGDDSPTTLASCCEVGGEVCEERTGQMMLCGRCLAVAYCSKAHQRSDFQRHKLVCTKPNAYLRHCYEVRRTQVALPASTTSIDDVD